jgi:hypothetical protein
MNEARHAQSILVATADVRRTFETPQEPSISRTASPKAPNTCTVAGFDSEGAIELRTDDVCGVA